MTRIRDRSLVVDAVDPAPDAPPPPPYPTWGWAGWAWRTLTSMRTAVILLALLAAAAIPGSLLPQRNVATDPAAVSVFVADNPTISPWLDRLGLFGVYSSAWFAAVYLLLLVSMTGCVLPRCARLWRNIRTAPPTAPRHLGRFEDYTTWESERRSDDLLEAARATLRGRRFRVVTSTGEVAAERGYLREVGNLLFHLSLLVLLFGIAAGRLFGFEGRVAVAEGGSFTNTVSGYDAFTPSVWTDTADLEPLSMTLDAFDVSYEESGPQRGQPREFDASVSYRGSDGVVKTKVVRPNEPLDVNETKMFLTGNGYAPRVTVRDGAGTMVVSGPVVFLPNDASFASDGVVKAADALPEPLGFRALFLPTAATGADGTPVSAYPDALNPELLVTAWTGDLGLASGSPQSVYTLDTSRMTPVSSDDGTPLRSILAVGDTLTLPDGRGSLTFDGVSRFANFQVARDPGKEVTLLAATVLLVGLTTSLVVRRRRVWVRVTETPAADGSPRSRVEVARLSLTRRDAPPGETTALLVALGRPLDPPDPAPRENRS